MDLLQSIVTIRQACLGLMCPEVPLQELLFRELDTDESRACYQHMFEQWLADDSHWRQEQGAIYRRRADYWKPFNAYTKRVYGGKHVVHAFFPVGLSWLPERQGGISPQVALTRFIDLLKRILDAKKKHANDPDTQRSQRDSGNHCDHSFRGTERGDLRDDRQEALLRLLQGERLHQRMAAAILEDGARQRNWENNWCPQANELWYGWNAKQRQLYRKHLACELSTEYLRLKGKYHDKCTTTTAKRFRLGPPRGF